MADKTANALKDKIVLKTLDLAAEQGWQYVTLRDVANAAEISMADLYMAIEDKNDILMLFGRMVDRKVAENIEAPKDDDSLSARDRLFDILMDRFDILNDHREGVTAILESFKCDPKQSLTSLPHLCHSMGWMLEMAGIETSGIFGALKVAGMSGVYLKTLKTWMDDDNPDLSKTMAALDKTLGHAESAANTFGF